MPSPAPYLSAILPHISSLVSIATDFGYGFKETCPILMCSESAAHLLGKFCRSHLERGWSLPTQAGRNAAPFAKNQISHHKELSYAL